MVDPSTGISLSCMYISKILKTNSVNNHYVFTMPS